MNADSPALAESHTILPNIRRQLSSTHWLSQACTTYEAQPNKEHRSSLVHGLLMYHCLLLAQSEGVFEHAMLCQEAGNWYRLLDNRARNGPSCDPLLDNCLEGLFGRLPQADKPWSHVNDPSCVLWDNVMIARFHKGLRRLPEEWRVFLKSWSSAYVQALQDWGTPNGVWQCPIQPTAVPRLLLFGTQSRLDDHTSSPQFDGGEWSDNDDKKLVKYESTLQSDGGQWPDDDKKLVRYETPPSTLACVPLHPAPSYGGGLPQSDRYHCSRRPPPQPQHTSAPYPPPTIAPRQGHNYGPIFASGSAKIVMGNVGSTNGNSHNFGPVFTTGNARVYAGDVSAEQVYEFFKRKR